MVPSLALGFIIVTQEVYTSCFLELRANLAARRIHGRETILSHFPAEFEARLDRILYMVF